MKALFIHLKAKEAELLQINKILEDSDLTASKYRQWKEQNEVLVQEIDRVAVIEASKGADGAAVQDTPTEEIALATPTSADETEGAYRLSLSDGEELVDAESSDVHLEISQIPASTETSPVFDFSLGSLQDAIKQELSETTESSEPADYFYI